ncbi:MAG: type I methionyl aminopeptidase [Myxococcales bacterium]|nr:type I methionyl aminopeptidase [Myxococcales bacterium]
MMIELKSAKAVEKMRAAGRLAAATLEMIQPHVQPGVSTERLNQLCHDFIVEHKATPAPLNYRGFPKSICTSINEVVCHGIPSSSRNLEEGDIINIDVTAILDGYHGDTSCMFMVGEVSDQARRLVETTKNSLYAGIEVCHVGARMGDIGHAIQSMVEPLGYSVVRDFTGHGIGRRFHEDPQVLHYGRKGVGPRMREGMTFTIEPMINIGTWKVEILDDDWTAVTLDRKLSAQFEHTILITADGVEILTPSSLF